MKVDVLEVVNGSYIGLALAIFVFLLYASINMINIGVERFLVLVYVFIGATLIFVIANVYKRGGVRRA